MSWVHTKPTSLSSLTHPSPAETLLLHHCPPSQELTQAVHYKGLSHLPLNSKKTKQPLAWNSAAAVGEVLGGPHPDPTTVCQELP